MRNRDLDLSGHLAGNGAWRGSGSRSHVSVHKFWEGAPPQCTDRSCYECRGFDPSRRHNLLHIPRWSVSSNMPISRISQLDSRVVPLLHRPGSLSAPPRRSTKFSAEVCSRKQNGCDIFALGQSSPPPAAVPLNVKHPNIARVARGRQQT